MKPAPPPPPPPLLLPLTAASTSRDLKPENIFIVGDPAVAGGERAKILDFGIAKLTGDDPGKTKTRTGTVIGTPVYMSPEQCRGAGASAIDPRSDIYSIGCVLMTMLTGRPPFDGAGSGDLIAAHLREAPPYAASRVPDLPEVLDQILQRCLAKSPNDRFPTMAALAQTLGHAERLLDSSSYAVASSLVAPMPMLPPGSLSGPTTLAGATGQRVIPAPRRRGLIAGTALTSMVVAATITTFAMRKPAVTDREPRAASSWSAKPTTPTATGAAIAGSATPTNAATAPPTTTGATVEGNATPTNMGPTMPAAAVDAGVDATITDVVVDAGAAKMTRSNKGVHKPASAGNHAPPSGENSVPVDRGD